jgi:hypothetical protein
MSGGESVVFCLVVLTHGDSGCGNCVTELDETSVGWFSTILTLDLP